MIPRREGHADDLMIVARVDGLVRERGMRPDDGSAGVAVVRINQMRTADLLVFLR